jgi:predicted Ser/Thr protein kinase
MPDDSRLLDLVVRWEELREAGQSVSPEQLCQDCPDLLPALRQRLDALGAMNAAMLTRDSHQDTVAGGANGAGQAAGGGISGIPGYEVVRELGRGGMGVVYLARQTGLDRLVALKMLLAGQHAAPAERARFQAEVKAIARLQHPNIVQVFEVGEHEGRAFYSMEYLDGGNLEDRIGSRPQPARQAAELVEVLARAIHAAHQKGIIHRDLKPANILLASRECDPPIADLVPRISDFGLAKLLDVSSGPTLTEHILGTPGYMAPEQASGRSKQVGPGTDVYALGAILYRVLTGRLPFQGESHVAVLRQVFEEDPIPPRRLQWTVPADLETICLKCLHKQPAHRYASAAALADDLHRFLAQEPILGRPIGRWHRLAKWARRRPAAAASIAVVGLALLVLLVAGWWFTQRLATELEKTDRARRTALAARRDLEQALARHVAEGLDSELRQLQHVPQAMADLLGRRVRWNEEDLEAWTRALVDRDKKVFGLCIAFEPGQFVGTRPHEDYCLYVHEKAGGLTTKQLLPPSYPPPFYRERDWYKNPQRAGGSWWSDAYLRQGADNTPMVTCSVPFYREGKFSGVVAADLSIEYFRGLHQELQNQFLGPNSYSLVLSQKGTLVYHPNPIYEFPSATSTLDRIQPAPDFLALVERMRQEETGRGRATDFSTGRPADFLFTRIRATDWYFVVVHADPSRAEGPEED